MAKVFQLKGNESDPMFDASLIDGLWHIGLYTVSHPQTGCGIQLEGEDGIYPGPLKEGCVTCSTCIRLIKEVQAIKKWQ